MFIRFYDLRASDNVCSPEFTNLVPQDIAEIFPCYHDMHYNATTERGVIFHLIGAVSKYGKLGMTCIGDSLEEAKSLHDRAIQLLKQEATKMD